MFSMDTKFKWKFDGVFWQKQVFALNTQETDQHLKLIL